MTRKRGPTKAEILIVDDVAEYRAATSLLLEQQGYAVAVAASSTQALAMLAERPFDAILLDYFLESNVTGETVIRELRRLPGPNQHAKIVLVTGYSGEVPPLEKFAELDIDGYVSKGEEATQLLLWVAAAVRGARSERQLRAMQTGMRYILAAVGVLHRVQPLDTLLQAVLTLLVGLLDVTHSFLATPEQPESFLALADGKSDTLMIRAGTGRFAEVRRNVAELLTPAELEALNNALRRSEIQVINNSLTVVPLVTGTTTVGIIYLARAVQETELAQFRELLRLFAVQAAVALDNARLYSQVTLDPLTRTMPREGLRAWLPGELTLAFRTNQPISALCLTITNLAEIIAANGNLAGNTALKTAADVLRQATRSTRNPAASTDVTARWEHETFMVLLPRTDQAGAQAVMERVLQMLAERAPEIGVHSGHCTLLSRGGGYHDVLTIPESYFASVADQLTAQAMKACATADDRLCQLEWPPLPPGA